MNAFEEEVERRYVWTICISIFVQIPLLWSHHSKLNVSGKNIVLNFLTEDYAKRNEPHFGETIGRVANRLKNATVCLNGRDYMLDKNDPANCIHGGFKGWEQQYFYPAQQKTHGRDAWRFSYTNKDSDGKFPETVEVTVWYTEYYKQDTRRKAMLEIEYEESARNMECEETAKHADNIYISSYFTLTGNKTIAGSKAQLYVRRYLPIDQTGIPNGTIKEFPDDITKQFELEETAPQINNCFVLKTTTDPKCLWIRASWIFNYLALSIAQIQTCIWRFSVRSQPFNSTLVTISM
ncbi:hypothetical protein ABOM_004349 [Aspergillus bombycis]|uniref:Aldose 1-epimerase n=1 Tax=Aspergillus bombycis TaxID=109264 RepID=A0A1F8A8V8_9EURO|nr:hypothetical protein ABOM_004349 [Aspergillus bombycis]OGM47728.1 hypothetical protein ABOM_004349 [Aspergillus bombycis]